MVNINSHKLAQYLKVETVKQIDAKYKRGGEMKGRFRRIACYIIIIIGCILLAGPICAENITPSYNLKDIADGERLVHNMDCNVCHTPKVLTPQGPQPDVTRLLSGHPSEEKLPPILEGIVGPNAWGGLFNNALTAWAGPWGISFGSNLTPDDETGIGSWTEEIFIDAMRTGMKVAGAGPVLPPMPTYSRLTDQELHAIYAYLRSIKPIKNTVPDSVPPSPPSQ